VKRLSFILPVLILSAFILSFRATAAGDIRVIINDTELVSDTGTYALGGNTYVPLRAFCTAMSADCRIDWDDKTRTASVSCDGLDISVCVYNNYVVANGRYLWMKNGVLIKNGRIHLPVRVLSECFGTNIAWSAASRIVSVSGGIKPITSGDKYYNSEDLLWLSRIISSESSGEPLSGQIAVGNVVLNRVACPDFPSTIKDVIFDTAGGVQFSPVANGTVYNEPTKSAVIAAKLVLDGAVVVSEALFFLNPDSATSFWITENRAFVADIGAHSFYL